mmetsp:Transcript_73212/g.158839  ORF Transcript_73212/g.158839 Transcript_73212/m.158839 type:complete len:124 (-) Transcript_73212:162-533(-)
MRTIPSWPLEDSTQLEGLCYGVESCWTASKNDALNFGREDRFRPEEDGERISSAEGSRALSCGPALGLTVRRQARRAARKAAFGSASSRKFPMTQLTGASAAHNAEAVSAVVASPARAANASV